MCNIQLLKNIKKLVAIKKAQLEVINTEKQQQMIHTLQKETKELEWNIQSLDKMIQCYEKRKKKGKRFILGCC